MGSIAVVGVMASTIATEVWRDGGRCSPWCARNVSVMCWHSQSGMPGSSSGLCALLGRVPERRVWVGSNTLAMTLSPVMRGARVMGCVGLKKVRGMLCRVGSVTCEGCALQMLLVHVIGIVVWGGKVAIAMYRPFHLPSDAWITTLSGWKRPSRGEKASAYSIRCGLALLLW